MHATTERERKAMVVSGSCPILIVASKLVDVHASQCKQRSLQLLPVAVEWGVCCVVSEVCVVEGDGGV
eukprot:4194030-Amphidinium_carterae.2